MKAATFPIAQKASQLHYHHSGKVVSICGVNFTFCNCALFFFVPHTTQRCGAWSYIRYIVNGEAIQDQFWKVKSYARSTDFFAMRAIHILTLGFEHFSWAWRTCFHFPPAKRCASQESHLTLDDKWWLVLRIFLKVLSGRRATWGRGYGALSASSSSTSGLRGYWWRGR